MNLFWKKLLHKIRWYLNQPKQLDLIQNQNTDIPSNGTTAPLKPEPENLLLTPLAVAKTQLGISEQFNADTIKRYHKAAGLNAGYAVPWCSSFVCWCFQMSDFKDQMIKSALSTDWLKFGAQTTAPKLGDLAILTRDSGAGHVGFVIEVTSNYIKLLSGNSDNQVQIKNYSIDRLVGYRTFK